MRAHLPILAAVLLLSAAARAQPRPDSPELLEARKQYAVGAELARATRWSEALAAFEQSNAYHPHPLTVFNMAVCERALGRALHARQLFRDAIRGAEAEPAQFPRSRLAEAKGYEAELTASLVTLDVKVFPGDARLSVDGRPLRVEGGQASAGISEPGDPQPVPGEHFALLVDPGAHTFRVVAHGHGDVLVSKTYAPGAKSSLDLELTTLPATIHVTANVDRPVVTLDGSDVGMAPLALSRPAGAYTLRVVKQGFAPFEAKVPVGPGQELDVPANLAVEHVPLVKRWWFWTAVGVAASGVAALTYGLTREASPPPAYQGGTTGWVVAPATK